MTTRYEVVDGEIVKVDETRTPFALERAAEALNELVADAGDYKKRIADLAAQLRQTQEKWSNTGNDLTVRDGQLAEAKKRIAELEAAQQAPAVTPEWLAKEWAKAADAMEVTPYGEWEDRDEKRRTELIQIAAYVLDQMPKAAPVVVDLKKLICDYHRDDHYKPEQRWPIWAPDLERALEAQGISCK